MDNFIDRFPVSEEIRKIFLQGLIEDKNKVLEILERYHFLGRDQLIEIIKNDDSFEFVNPDIVQSKVMLESDILYTINGSEVNAFIKGYDTVNTNRFELKFSKYNVNFYRITPENYYQLAIPDYEPQYDAIILFKKILLDAIALHATDVHFDTKHFEIHPEYTVSFRIDTEMVPYTEFKLNESLNREIISKLVENKTSVTSLDLNSPDGITAVAKDVFSTGLAELRISANKCLDGYHYVIRIQQKNTVSLTIDELGFADTVVSDLYYVTRKRSGITLITGAVRTGKNTTAFAIENELVKQPIKLVSYEYPIEVLMPVSQVDYANDTNVLLNAIRLAKKQDANVAFLNEIPNKEVAFAVQDLVNSSIHVITTMHLDRLWLLPYRLKEYYGSSYKDVISQINAVFNQKMFSVPCPYCKRQIMVDSIRDERKRNVLKKYGINFAYENTGCAKCNHTGHIPGRNQPYVEHITFSQDLISALLRCDETYQMELELHDRLITNNTTLENYMVSAIGAGNLALDALDSII